ncbi:MAG: serine/threonine-protein kinase [Polyangiaceae bacterium]
MNQRCTEEDLPIGIGDVVDGKYSLLRVVGRGGMGLVFEAQHLGFGQSVAIKFLLPKYAANGTVRLRFLHEARALCRLRGENVARVLDTDELPEGLPYIVMEFLHGSSIADHLARCGPLEIQEAVDVVLQAAVGVAEAHALGIIDRDLKPANLFLTLGSDRLPLVKVLDFGISKVLDDEDERNAPSDSVLGSPQYMSPEQMLAPARVDTRTDIWSLGVILFELLAGRLPFPGRTLLVLFTESLAPPDLTAIRAEVSPKLASVVARCLARQRSERFDSVALLARALLPFGSSRSAAWVERIERITGESSERTLAVSVPDRATSPDNGASTGVTRNGKFGSMMRANPLTLAVLIVVVTGLVGVGWRRLLSGSVPVRSSAALRSSVPSSVLAATPRTSSTQMVSFDERSSAPGEHIGSSDVIASCARLGPVTAPRLPGRERSRQVRRRDVDRAQGPSLPTMASAEAVRDEAMPTAPIAPTRMSTSSGSDPLQLDSRH